MNTPRKLISILLCITLVICLFAGCSNQSDNSESAEKKTFVVRLEAQYNSLDPAYCQSTSDMVMCNNFYSKLIKLAPVTNEIVGDLAEDWTVSNDGKVFTFTLRKGAKFHDGSEVKAEDIVFTTERIIEKDYQFIFSNVDLVSCKALDDYTVEFTLAQPCVPFLYLLCGNFFVVSKNFCEAGNDLAETPMGTGPYKFITYTEGYEVEAEAFTDYYKGSPEIEKVTYRIVSDSAAEAAALRTGDLSYGDMGFTTYNELKNEPYLETIKPASWLLLQANMNCASGPFANAKVRQAVGYAIDRQELINTALEGYGDVGSYYAPTSVVDFPKSFKEKFDYNPEKAKALLEEAGYSDGFDMSLIITGENQPDAVVIQSNLSKLGINVKIEEMEWAAMTDLLAAGDFDMALITCGTGDFMDAWSPFVTTTGVYNDCHYGNPELDKLLAEAVTLTDPTDVEKCYYKAMEIYMEDVPLHGLYEYALYNVINTDDFRIKEPITRIETLEIFNLGYAE